MVEKRDYEERVLNYQIQRRTSPTRFQFTKQRILKVLAGEKDPAFEGWEKEEVEKLKNALEIED